jgi:molybdate transport system substrate-binding protein
MRFLRLALVALLCFGVASACGSSRGATTQADTKLVVFAAASLSHVLPQLDKSNEYEFGGSNALTFQIEQGAPADVFVSAAPKYLVRLRDEGLLYQAPSWFATNRLVLIVPRSNRAHIRTPRDLLRRGVTIALGAQGVPAGDYARASLASMHLNAALKNVVTLEPDVEGVVQKVALGEVDAGFAYHSDTVAQGKRLREIPLPRSGREVAVYGVAPLKSAKNATDARGFVALLLSPPGQARLKLAGFGPALKQTKGP